MLKHCITYAQTQVEINAGMWSAVIRLADGRSTLMDAYLACVCVCVYIIVMEHSYMTNI